MGKQKAYKDKHEFALWIESLSLLIQKKTVNDTIIITDDKLLHRMMHVLRLNIEDSCIFFDQEVYATVIIQAYIGKKQIQVLVSAIHSTIKLQPHVTFLLPLLKRDDYEAALYALTEVGVNAIQLIYTQKTGNQWSGDRDKDRAERILIAAAEQSKNFAYPTLYEPILLTQALKKYSNVTNKLFFDPQGKHLFDVMKALRNDSPDHIVLLVGPEGDLDSEEKKLVLANNFIFCALTPTIMRAVQAAALSAGFVRSLLM